MIHQNPEIDALLQTMNHASLPGVDLSLTRMVALLEALGNPQHRLPPVIHLAGTNGKGSTQAFLRAMAEAAGYRVHAYTSPHLVRFNERILLSGEEISDEALLPLLRRVRQVSASIPVTFFEATTAAAFLAFAEQQADLLLLETGLGGRLDATNMVAAPIATVITPVDIDHMEFLGDSIASIAGEKAGIIKRGAPCILGVQTPEAAAVIARVAAEKNAPITAHGAQWDYVSAPSSIRVTCENQSWTLPLPALAGDHQHHNAALASVVMHQCRNHLPVSNDAMAQAVVNVRWPGRLQRLSRGPLVKAWGGGGTVYVDGGHNVNAAHALAAWLRHQPQPVTLLWGMMQRKDAAAFLAPLAPFLQRVIAVRVVGEGESHAPQTLVAVARAAGIAHVQACETIADAARDVAAAPVASTAPHPASEAKGTLLIAGSLFLAGEILKNHA